MKGRRALAGELLLVALGLVLGGVGLSLLAGGGVVFSKPLWLDEYHSLLVATSSTVGDAWRSLSRGADFNPPLLHLLLRPLALDGIISPVELRAFSFLSVNLALLVLYRLLRHDFAPLPSLAGVLVVWGHPEVVIQTFEGRFYGPMLLFSALLALSLQNRGEHSAWAKSLLAVSSVALCTIHYFGIFPWTLLVGAAAWVEQ
jgi:hypothetical protein